MKIHFWREGDGSSLDQPTIYEQMSGLTPSQGFAAVLGQPVDHSWSPTFHHSRFIEQNLHFVAISLHKEEVSLRVLEFLGRLGLRAAAVTSPLKNDIFQVLSDSSSNQILEFHRDPTLEGIDSLNTLFIDQKNWTGANTDLKGFEIFWKDLKIRDSDLVVIWGGGGTLPVLKKVIPHAILYSSRRGEWRGPQNSVAQTSLDSESLSLQPVTLVWAAGDADQSRPPDEWQIERVIDLSYAEDSRGIELAQSRQCDYVSGKFFFEAQALEQQKLWTQWGVLK